MPEIQPIQDLATLRAAALAEHYQKTMELVTHHWERRSRQFVTLVAVLAGAALVAFARRLIAPALEGCFSQARALDRPRRSWIVSMP